jgi:hypothetical protein
MNSKHRQFEKRFFLKNFASMGAFLGLVSGLSGPAQGAFVATDGRDPQAVRRAKLSVAVVKVVRVQVNRRRKQKRYLLYRHVDLQIVKPLYGRPVTAAQLQHIPYATQMNSAWPLMSGKSKLLGSHFIMGWAHGRPCGLGRTVSFGRVATLPIRVSGPNDPRVSAIAGFLALGALSANARQRAWRRAFGNTKRPILARLADTALNRIQKKRKHSFARYQGLLRLLKPQPIDPLVGLALINAVAKFPAIASKAEFSRWVRRNPRIRSPRTRPFRVPAFDPWRKKLQRKLARIAASRKTEVNLRRTALALLAKPPSVVARRKDRRTRAALAMIQARLKDPKKEIRRAAVSALLRAGKRLRKVAPKQAAALYRRVLKVRDAEPAPAERAILNARIQSIW